MDGWREWSASDVLRLIKQNAGPGSTQPRVAQLGVFSMAEESREMHRIARKTIFPQWNAHLSCPLLVLEKARMPPPPNLLLDVLGDLSGTSLHPRAPFASPQHDGFEAAPSCPLSVELGSQSPQARPSHRLAMINPPPPPVDDEPTLLSCPLSLPHPTGLPLLAQFPGPGGPSREPHKG